MFWKSRTSSVTISAELHDKILRTCTPIGEDFGEIVAVRVNTRAANVKTGAKSRSDAPVCTHVGGPVALHFVY